jgi:glycogen synthase
VYVVMVAPECAPAAKAGDLGDVAFGLSRELELRGHAVEIVLPKYASIHYGEVSAQHVPVLLARARICWRRRACSSRAGWRRPSCVAHSTSGSSSSAGGCR